MSKPYKKWNVGLPGGPAGPFYSVISQDGEIIANQIPSKANAELIAALPELLAGIDEVNGKVQELLDEMKKRGFIKGH